MALPARRWDPFAAFDDLHEEMSRLLTNAFPDVSRIRVNAWSPPVDVQESDDAYVIEADVPGVKPEEINVEAEGREVRISGDIGEEDREGVVHRGGRSRGHFDYRVTLPGDVNNDGCDAQLEHGVLKLRLPKNAAASRRRIPIRGGANPELVHGEAETSSMPSGTQQTTSTDTQQVSNSGAQQASTGGAEQTQQTSATGPQTGQR